MRHAPAALLSALLGCSGVAPVSQPSQIASIAPDAEPAEPLPAPEPYAEALNTEFYLGSREDEEALFRDFTEQIRAIQVKQSQDNAQPIQRGFHAKAHGCLSGSMELLADRDARTKHGIFAEGKGPWPVWVRYSNGVGWRQSDDTLDARGMAVKVMGVDGKKYLPDEQATQDFLMTNSPTPVGRNAVEFMKFAHANASGRISGLLFLLGHLGTAGALLDTDPIPSAATAQYWSGGAFHLGAHQAVKFTAKPCAGSKEREPEDDDDPDYLTKDLRAAAREGLCFTFFVQFQVDPERTPIEHASREWEEDIAPLVPVANIVMPPQDLDAPERKAFCDQLSYSPWHSIAAHKPMGHINRARRFVYEASRAHRRGGVEPTSPEVPPVAPPP